MRAEVENGLNDARQLMGAEPASAEQNLKLTLEQIERSPDLEPTSAASFGSRSKTRFARRTRRPLVVADRLAAAEEQRAIAIELERLNERLVQREQRIKQIMDRFDSLMEEGRYQLADEEIVPEIERLAPDTTIESVGDGGRPHAAGGVRERAACGGAADNNFLRTMFQVELSLVPFPDEPPIVYMPADQWEDLTIRRQKYKAVDLGKQGGSESGFSTS